MIPVWASIKKAGSPEVLSSAVARSLQHSLQPPSRCRQCAVPVLAARATSGILNYALTLEYLEAAFYNGATAVQLLLSAPGTGLLEGH